MEEKKLTNYQAKILKEIVDGSIEVISYHKPQKTISNHKVLKQLEGIVKDKSRNETLTALDSLENDFGILDLDTTIKFGFSRCGYRVNLDKAKELYHSYLKEKEFAGSY